MFAVVAEMTELGPRVNGSRVWNEAEQKIYSALLKACKMNKRAELFSAGYTVLGGFLDLSFSLI